MRNLRISFVCPDCHGVHNLRGTQDEVVSVALDLMFDDGFTAMSVFDEATAMDLDDAHAEEVLRCRGILK